MSELQSNRRGANEIAGAIRQQILNGVLSGKDRLPPERVLAEQFDVARGTVRQALNRLASESLVEIRPGSGTYVIGLDLLPGDPVIQEARPLELIDARFALEPHICRLAVLHARADDFAKAEELLTLMEQSTGDSQAFSRADTQFHTQLATWTGNNLLIWVIKQINSVRSQEQWSKMLRVTLDEAMIHNYVREHRQIVDAIRNRDAERAAQSMKTHLETARLSLMRAASA